MYSIFNVRIVEYFRHIYYSMNFVDYDCRYKKINVALINFSMRHLFKTKEYKK